MEIKQTGSILTVTLDMSNKGYKTEKGNTVIETTHGFKDVGNGYSLSLNLIKKKD